MNSVDNEKTEISCPDCDSQKVHLSYETRKFEYGIGSEEVTLSATVPMYRCADCEYAFVGPQAMDIEHTAICRHLGVLTPSEIKAIRVKLALSQSAFAVLTGLGSATIARWESGSIIQNRSYDNLLRLLSYPENIDRLKAGFNFTASNTVSKFIPRALPQEQLGKLQSSKEHFSLRVG